MIPKFHRRHFIRVIAPRMLGLSTAFILGSCNQNQAAENSSATAASNTTSGIKAKVLRIGYQQAGDLVRVSGVLEKRLEPLGVKVQWLQFKQGPQLMEGMNVGRVDLGSVGNNTPIYAQAAGADIV
ncbi:sulfonate ABC transporter substrate-binding protein, partial [Aetokthonos hydrillicola CCALA 1050]|nr:sulfonate ABC transporter substrate-binding protein [Aetokthonos hydrillicola CCALA 1050]